jgi:putative ABC transport system ATP-binding protein
LEFANMTDSQTQSAPVVLCQNVQRIYQQESVPVYALRGASLAIEAGEFVSLAGPSGSGKSTLLNVIGGLDGFDAGEVTVGGTNLGALNAAELAEMRLNKVGFVFQAYNLIPVLSARENVEFILQLQGVSSQERQERANGALQSLGLGELGDRRPGELSGGQQQRVAIARAIVTEPVLLLADEPTANLDSKTTSELLEVLQQLNQQQGMTIVTATHDPIVMSYTSRQVAMMDGEIHQDSASAV